jgi:hypothetical protein
MKIRTLGIGILLLGAAGVASADQHHDYHGTGMSHDWFNDRRESAVAAPEIDPAGIVAALTLLAGASAVLRGRRRMLPNA